MMGRDAARAKSLFLAASELADPVERAAFLDRECGGDAQLRQQVELLLRAHDEAPLPRQEEAAATLDSDGGQSPTQDYADPTARSGSVLAGKYKLVEEIGAGGMGTVFLAQQSEPVKRAVAVKVVKAGMDSKAVLARFNAERQALALMDHPNIAKVLDAGATDAGRPFFVMELVRGVPITQFCDERRLTPRERLELFVPVCQAIQHAHQKGIIHRDIKPSNVLVALYDDRAVPKVIDFGVAKATGSVLTDLSLLTGFGAVVGTPEYMSPEQAQFNNLDIDSRSDVYSLGVLLYELLTGTTPVDRKSLGQAALLEILRIVREVEAPRPSAKLSSLETLPSVAANRGIAPARLSRMLSGELDWVVLKALEKNRARRYETANALARDLQRYLADEMVEARPPSVPYRLKKFVRKHKGPVIAASLVLLALLAGVVGTSWGMIEARRQEKEAKRQEGIARNEALEKEAARAAEAKRAAAEEVAKHEAQERLEQLSHAIDVLGQVFDEVNPDSEEREGRPLRLILGDRFAKAADQLESRAIGDPGVSTKLQLTLARSLMALGQATRAIPLLETALAACETHRGENDLATLEVQNLLGTALLYAGNSKQAVEVYERTLAAREKLCDPDDLQLLISRDNLAVTYRELGRLDEAIKLFEETFAAFRRKYGDDHPDTQAAVNNLTTAYLAAGRHREAVGLLRDVVARIRSDDFDHPSVLISRGNLAMAYLGMNQPDEALPFAELASKQAELKLGPYHPVTVNAKSTLASVLASLDRPDLAIQMLEPLTAGLAAHPELRPKDALTVRFNLAMAYSHTQQTSRALEIMPAILEESERVLGTEHPTTIQFRSGLARTLGEAGRLPEALPLLARNVELASEKYGLAHRVYLAASRDLAEAYRVGKQLERATTLLEDTLQRCQDTLGDSDTDTDSCRVSLALAYRAVGRAAEAAALLEESLRVNEQQQGMANPSLNVKRMVLASTYKDAGMTDRAVAMYERALQPIVDRWGEDHELTDRTRVGLATAYRTARQPEKAVTLWKQTLESQSARLGTSAAPTLVTRLRLADEYQAAGQVELAIPLLEQVLEMRTATLPADHPDVASARGALASAYENNRQLERAIPLLEQNLALTDGQPETAESLAAAYRLSTSLTQAGQRERALTLLERVVQGRTKLLGPDHFDTNLAGRALARAYLLAGRPAEAIAPMERAVRFDQTKWGPTHRFTLFAKAQLAEAYTGAGRVTEALTLYSEVLTLIHQLPTTLPGHARDLPLMSVLRAYGTLLMGESRYAEAEPLWREVLDLAKRYPQAKTTQPMDQFSLAVALVGQQKMDEGGPLLKESYAELQQGLGTMQGPPRRQIQLHCQRLSRFYAELKDAEQAAEWEDEAKKWAQEPASPLPSSTPPQAPPTTQD